MRYIVILFFKISKTYANTIETRMDDVIYDVSSETFLHRMIKKTRLIIVNKIKAIIAYGGIKVGKRRKD